MSNEESKPFRPLQPPSRGNHDVTCPNCGSRYIAKSAGCPLCGSQQGRVGNDEIVKKITDLPDLVK